MIAMIGTNGRRPARGFSLLELMIVVGITLVVAAIAIPGVFTATQNFKLRSTASSLSGLIQKCRMLAVARNVTGAPNGYYAVRSTGTSPVQVFIDMNNSGTLNTNTTENTNVLVPPSMVFDTTGGGFALTSMNLSYTTPVVALPAFNARGLPCIVSGGVCTVTGQGYIYYLRQDRAIGATGWAAVTVSPAGRAQVWTWDGGKWE